MKLSEFKEEIKNYIERLLLFHGLHGVFQVGNDDNSFFIETVPYEFYKFLVRKHYPANEAGVIRIPFNTTPVIDLKNTSDDRTLKELTGQSDEKDTVEQFENQIRMYLLDISRQYSPLNRDIGQNLGHYTTVIEGYIDSIWISNFLTARDKIMLSNLANHREIYFLGENGDGKTVVLQAILIALRWRYIYEDTEWKDTGRIFDLVEKDSSALLTVIDDHGRWYGLEPEVANISLYRSNPELQEKYMRFAHQLKNAFAYGVHRSRNDSEKKDKHGFMSLFDPDQYLESPAGWLMKLYTKDLESKVNKKKNDSISLNTAKSILRDLLDKNIEIKVDSDGVTFTEKGSKVAFEDLSEGYKSIMIWVVDLLARLSKNQPGIESTKYLSGVVLVDEINLHLHPKWEYSIVQKLRKWFPKIQFIFTTHSPITVLGASKDAVFYKVYKEDGVTKVSEPLEDISEFMANALITSPLFGLHTMAARTFKRERVENMTDDDYIYKKIHEAIAEKIDKHPGLLKDDQMMDWIREELKKLDEEQ